MPFQTPPGPPDGGKPTGGRRSQGSLDAAQRDMGKALADAPGLENREEVGLFAGTSGEESRMAANPGGAVSLDSAGRSVVAVRSFAQARTVASLRTRFCRPGSIQATGLIWVSRKDRGNQKKFRSMVTRTRNAVNCKYYHFKESMMKSASLTSKGQVTIPAEVRRRLHLHPGARVGFIVEDDKVRIVRQENKDRGGLRTLQTGSVRDRRRNGAGGSQPGRRAQ